MPLSAKKNRFSPLLSNIVLDELDRELDQRGHRFVRYADDANTYVKSERAGQRVMASIKSFIEKRLRLKVNESKSAVAKPEGKHFLGFRLKCEALTEEVEVLISKRTKDRIIEKIRELTPRNWGKSMNAAITQINVYLVGWIGFFGICTPGAERALGNLDAHVRRRLRAMQLRHWKRRRTQARKLIRLGVPSRMAWRGIYDGRKSTWKLSHSPAVERGLLKTRTVWSRDTSQMECIGPIFSWPSNFLQISANCVAVLSKNKQGRKIGHQ